MSQVVDLLYIHSLASDSEHERIFPMGIIAMLNSLEYRKQGVYSDELTPELIKNSKIILLDLHWYFHLKSVEKVAHQIKQIDPTKPIIVGGYTATIYAKNILENFAIDYVIRGDGEEPLKLLVDSLLKNHSDLLHIPNLTTADWETPQSYTISQSDFNKTNNLDISWFKSALPYYYAPTNQYPMFFIPITRGCYYNCSWCYGSRDNQKTLCNRAAPIHREAKSIKAELLKASANKNINYINLTGDAFELVKLKKVSYEYVEEIFSEQYDLAAYYEFYNLPTIADLELIRNCFTSVRFALNYHKVHGQSSELNDPKKIHELGEYIAHHEKCSLVIYGELKEPAIAKLNSELKKYTRVTSEDNAHWQVKTPTPGLSDTERDKEFSYFYNL